MPTLVQRMLFGAVAFLFLLGGAQTASAGSVSADQFYKKVLGKTVLFKKSNIANFDFVAYFPSKNKVIHWTYATRDGGPRRWAVWEGKSGTLEYCLDTLFRKKRLVFGRCLDLDDTYASIGETRSGDIFGLWRRRHGPFSIGPSISSLDSLLEKAKKYGQ